MAIKSFVTNPGKKPFMSGKTSLHSLAPLKSQLGKLDFRMFRGKKMYQKTMRNLMNNPTVLIVASAVGAYFLGRFAYRYYKSHPAISEFVKDNLDKVESRLKVFKGGRETKDIVTQH